MFIEQDLKVSIITATCESELPLFSRMQSRESADTLSYFSATPRLTR